MNHVTIKGFDAIEARGRFDEEPALAAQANEQAVGGFSDWVFPDTMTLLALQKIAPANCWVWSSSPYGGSSYYAWLVDFDYGFVGISSYGRSYDFHVRLVRASQVLALVALAHRAALEEAGIVLAALPAQQEPPQRQPWVGLTDEDDIIGMARDAFAARYCALPVLESRIKTLAEAIEAKLREKNGITKGGAA